MIVNRRELLQKGCVRARRLVVGAIEAALESCDAKTLVRNHVRRRGNELHIDGTTFVLDRFDSIHVVGGGKASGHMAVALHEILGERISGGMVIVPDYLQHELGTGNIKLCRASHPIPDRRGVEATRRILGLAANLGRRDLVICLLSGGGSALMPLPYGRLTLRAKQRITRKLLGAGAAIDEVNCVRKHLSAVKGGRLAERFQRTTMVSLIISDVVGDRLDTIASGPTVPDGTTFRDAMLVLKKYGLWNLSRDVRTLITGGVAGRVPETPKRHSIFRNVHNFIIGSNQLACDAAARYLKARRIGTAMLPNMKGGASSAGMLLASLASRINLGGRPLRRPAAIVMGGETTVSVKGSGRGGRNQELVLAACRMIDGLHDTVIASVGTDGIDGNSDAAGAMADSLTLGRARRMRMDADRFLANNDSNAFFRRLRDTVQTGPTGTNVNDVAVLLCL